MTATIILWSRALGTVLSWPLVAVIALVAEILRQAVQTARTVWSPVAVAAVATTKDEQAAREKKAKEDREKGKKKAEAKETRRQVGAIWEGV